MREWTAGLETIWGGVMLAVLCLRATSFLALVADIFQGRTEAYSNTIGIREWMNTEFFLYDSILCSDKHK